MSAPVFIAFLVGMAVGAIGTALVGRILIGILVDEYEKATRINGDLNRTIDALRRPEPAAT